MGDRRQEKSRFASAPRFVKRSVSLSLSAHGLIGEHAARRGVSFSRAVDELVATNGRVTGLARTRAAGALQLALGKLERCLAGSTPVTMSELRAVHTLVNEAANAIA